MKTVVLFIAAMALAITTVTSSLALDTEKQPGNIDGRMRAAVLQYLSASTRSDFESMEKTISPEYLKANNPNGLQWYPDSYGYTNFKITKVSPPNITAEIWSYNIYGKFSRPRRLTFEVREEQEEPNTAPKYYIVPGEIKLSGGILFVIPWKKQEEFAKH